MRDRQQHWESTFAKLCILRDACKDPQVALFLVAYLVAGMNDEQLDRVLTATMEFETNQQPMPDIAVVHSPRN